MYDYCEVEKVEDELARRAECAKPYQVVTRA